MSTVSSLSEDLLRLNMNQNGSFTHNQTTSSPHDEDNGSEVSFEDEPLFVIQNNEELRTAFRKYRICEENLSLLTLKKKKINAVIAEEMQPLKHEKARLEPAISAYMKSKNQKSVSVDRKLFILTTKASSKKAPKEDVLASLSELGIEEPDKVYDLVNGSRIKKENPIIKIDI